MLFPEAVEKLRRFSSFDGQMLIAALEFNAVELQVSFCLLVGSRNSDLLSAEVWCLLFYGKGNNTPSAKEVYYKYEFTDQETEPSSTSVCPALGLAATVRSCRVSGSEQLFLSITRSNE